MLDIVLVFIPTYLCRHLQMNVLFKLQVFSIFALRLLILPLVSLFYRDWKAAMHSNNTGVDRTSRLVYQQCQLCCSLVAATIPCLKSFIQSFDTGSGQKARFSYSLNSNAYGRVSRVHHSIVQADHREVHQIDRLNHKARGRSRLGHIGSSNQVMRVNRKTSGDVGSTVEEGLELDRRSMQESDRKSQHSTQELIIRKDVQFHVKRESANDNEVQRPGLLRLPR